MSTEYGVPLRALMSRRGGKAVPGARALQRRVLTFPGIESPCKVSATYSYIARSATSIADALREPPGCRRAVLRPNACPLAGLLARHPHRRKGHPDPPLARPGAPAISGTLVQSSSFTGQPPLCSPQLRPEDQITVQPRSERTDLASALQLAYRTEMFARESPVETDLPGPLLSPLFSSPLLHSSEMSPASTCRSDIAKDRGRANHGKGVVVRCCV